MGFYRCISNCFPSCTENPGYQWAVFSWFSPSFAFIIAFQPKTPVIRLINENGSFDYSENPVSINLLRVVLFSGKAMKHDFFVVFL